MSLANSQPLVCAAYRLLCFGEQTTRCYPTVETNQQHGYSVGVDCLGNPILVKQCDRNMKEPKFRVSYAYIFIGHLRTVVT